METTFQTNKPSIHHIHSILYTYLKSEPNCSFDSRASSNQPGLALLGFQSISTNLGILIDSRKIKSRILYPYSIQALHEGVLIPTTSKTAIAPSTVQLVIMFAARDQENVAFRQRQGAALKSQQGQTKTPGPGFSKTPLKVPLNDENTARLLTAKAGKNGERAIAATPMVGELYLNKSGRREDVLTINQGPNRVLFSATKLQTQKLRACKAST